MVLKIEQIHRWLRSSDHPQQRGLMIISIIAEARVTDDAHEDEVYAQKSEADARARQEVISEA